MKTFTNENCWLSPPKWCFSFAVLCCLGSDLLLHFRSIYRWLDGWNHWQRQHQQVNDPFRCWTWSLAANAEISEWSWNSCSWDCIKEESKGGYQRACSSRTPYPLTARSRGSCLQSPPWRNAGTKVTPSLKVQIDQAGLQNMQFMWKDLRLGFWHKSGTRWSLPASGQRWGKHGLIPGS